MVRDFWHLAHQQITAEIYADLRLDSKRRLTFYILALTAFAVGTALSIIYEVPMHRTAIIVSSAVLILALPVLYIVRLIEFPAKHAGQHRAAIAVLTTRLNGIGATEGTLIRLSELLHAAKQLQDEAVRSEAHFDAWTSDYQTVLQVIYSEMHAHISHSAAMAFISHPVLKPTYTRGAFNDQHATMKALLDRYVVKLTSVIAGYYLHLKGPVEPRSETVSLAA